MRELGSVAGRRLKTGCRQLIIVDWNKLKIPLNISPEKVQAFILMRAGLFTLFTFLLGVKPEKLTNLFTF